MNLRIVIATAFLLASSIFTRAQINTCGTDLINQKYAEEHPERLEYREQMQSIISEAAANGNGEERNTIIIPTVVHVMHMGGNENISNAQVHDAIRIMNEDLRRQNADTANTRPIFKPYGADFNVEFRLAKIDPNGNCTNGITNTFSPITNKADDDIKNTALGGLTPWPVNKYFNIWVVGRIMIGENNVIGYAYFPSWGISNNYGIVINHRYFGTIGSAQGEDGRTLTHEAGHCLELYHTFQSGCGSNCSNSGDNVCDTPPSASATYACGFALNSCSNDANGPSPYAQDVPDMVENYMSYNQGFCQNIFTKGQKLRSDAVFQNTFVGQLVTPQNLTATGTSNGFVGTPCVLQPNFKWSKSVICVGDSVLFSDLTQQGTPDSYQWNISGPVNLSASGATPTIIFDQPGMYTVTLLVTNSVGTQSIAKQNIIRVSDAVGTAGWEFVDGFDNQPISGGRWQTRNSPFASGWEERTTSNGNFTAYVNNVNNSNDNIMHEIYSPVYDLSGVIEPKIAFKTAYATKNGVSSDRLKMFISNNCGTTWIPRFTKTGAALASMPPSNQPVEPQTASDWYEWISAVPPGMVGSPNFMIKFTFETGGGNNVYIDDINISRLASINEFTNGSALKVWPNPTSDVFTLDLSSLPDEPLQFFMYDMSGRVVASRFINGGTAVDISMHDMGLSVGIYRISIQGKTAQISAKIILTN